ncbi:DUF1236 domain-containing protein [Methylobacterium sp. NPDC080182]|uniref:DUF1236 domain-containing protein n=1 Tax=Methylobacterium sp. NPDC080182 TaxID=3390590 RepID=UPI003CFC2D06
MRHKLLSAATLAILMSPQTHAQGLLHGAEQGASDGHAIAGPLGAIVGGAVGAATGAVGGLLGVEERPRFSRYVRERGEPSYAYPGDTRLGSVLRYDGIDLHDVPDGYAARGYRYGIVNDRILIVDPRTGRIVDALD